ncbi:cation-translocating P-type ATPase [Latilactobacillus curvatus]|uniref:P-type Ca(2+) transporter n=2 Tax=Latilactobacillus curvatus TaxID=28038 RepID=A0AAJ5REX6_LATCU|nr:cation-translocating P-type ATPase [Latilactobacillus curvatus]AZP96947.1 cation-translocating P-type ATPase [Latilactobacillus curvatus]KRK90422.1 ATPase, P-type (transporting), HAD super, subIC family protein [Latilactobacillus curvatus JCM 1096 = DSM 20019]MCP8866041.1 cation-translocating P-type ATPase [Latilactobacillus curvatus]MCP8870160.1 cation-translocating P-type ATPase [Latilactobacillus curvatus]MCP8878028.1 cation-translocating P-type ATPase [Latilactobacillus curvatus]
MTDQPSSFFTQSTDETLKSLATTTDGLTQDQVAERLAKYGRNQLTETKRKSLFVRFLEQFKDFMIIVLLVAAMIAGFLAHEWPDAIIILAVVILNAVFGVFQEAKAEQAIDALKEMATPDAHVRRNGQIVKIKSEELVVGDIVLLEAGDIVPADLRLLESAALKIEESALTGESVPVDKTVATLTDPESGIGDRTNMAFMNSNVTYGRGVGVVTGTGMQTEVGKIAGMLNQAGETTTPLQMNLSQLGKSLTIMILIIAAVVFVVGYLRHAQSPINMLLTSISLAVAAIPEGLPAIVTVILALGTQKMVKRNALVRKLPAVETLGSTDIIASDKTGTLTMNQMTVEKIFTNNQLQEASADLAGDDLALSIMNLANDTKITEDGQLIGDPTETALIAYGRDKGFVIQDALAAAPRVGEVPFDSERKLMTTIHQAKDGQLLMTTKGAPDELLKRVSHFIDANGDVQPLDEDERQFLLKTNHDLAKQALRVLALAYKPLDSLPATIDPTIEDELIFAGLVGMIDPERPEAKQAVTDAHSAGIRTLMITGDHRDTAEAIALRLGIITPEQDADAAVVTGAELDQMDDETFAKKVSQYAVYARVAPEHKVRIVKAWQKHGKVVAMTGDGVNDAPALKSADIGIGMGITGTEVSKGASDMVLADDNFSTIVVAVKEGRKVFANIQKSIQYLLSANLGEVLTLFMMTILGWQILQPVHILWINLVTDTFPAIALGVEPTEPGIMNQKPRGRKSNFFSGGVFQAIIYQGLLEGGITLGVYALAITYPVHQASGLAHADALTMAYATLGMIQLFHAFNVKSVHQSIFTVGFFKNKAFNWAVLASFLLLAATIMVPGLNGLFHVSHLDIHQWGIVLAASFSLIVIVEIVKFFQRRMAK